MHWTAERLDRLYELYRHFIDRLRNDIIQANRSLGSKQPEKTKLEVLPRAEFEALLMQPRENPEVTRLWVRRIIRGHEHEFPEWASDVPGSQRLRTGT